MLLHQWHNHNIFKYCEGFIFINFRGILFPPSLAERALCLIDLGSLNFFALLQYGIVFYSFASGSSFAPLFLVFSLVFFPII